MKLEGWFVQWFPQLATLEELKLNPQWPLDHKHDCFRRVHELTEAHGITFACPKCGEDIQIYFEGSPVPNHLGTNKNNITQRWKVVSGTSLEDLTLQPSIQKQDINCNWHGYITNGEVN